MSEIDWQTFAAIDWAEVFQASLDTLTMLGVSLAFTVLIGLPLGVLLFLTAPGQLLARPRHGRSDGRSETVCLQGRLDMHGPLGRRRHAAKADTDILDMAILEPQPVTGSDGRDVLVAPLAHLVAEEDLTRPQPRHRQALDHLVGRQRRLAIANEELLQRQVASTPTRDQPDAGLQRQQRGRHVADGRGVADIAAEIARPPERRQEHELEGGILEDPAAAPPDDLCQWTTNPEQAPDKAES